MHGRTRQIIRYRATEWQFDSWVVEEVTIFSKTCVNKHGRKILGLELCKMYLFCPNKPSTCMDGQFGDCWRYIYFVQNISQCAWHDNFDSWAMEDTCIYFVQIIGPCAWKNNFDSWLIEDKTFFVKKIFVNVHGMTLLCLELLDMKLFCPKKTSMLFEGQFWFLSCWRNIYFIQIISPCAQKDNLILELLKMQLFCATNRTMLLEEQFLVISCRRYSCSYFVQIIRARKSWNDKTDSSVVSELVILFKTSIYSPESMTINWDYSWVKY